jgi:rhodanese-related sulfurtransferase
MAKQHSPQFLAIVSDAKSRVRECTIRDLKEAIDSKADIVVLDVREESEFAAGHVPGAVSLGKGIIERDIEHVVPNPSQKIMLYCGGGFRSALAADNLQKMGYQNVLSVDGGWRAWTEAGYAS